MSIREHLAKPQPERIHNLSLESKERPKLLFDTERDISPSDWDGMRKELAEQRSSRAIATSP